MRLYAGSDEPLIGTPANLARGHHSPDRELHHSPDRGLRMPRHGCHPCVDKPRYISGFQTHNSQLLHQNRVRIHESRHDPNYAYTPKLASF